MKCPSCGSEMIRSIDGNAEIWKCNNCGEELITSHILDIEQDTVTYHIDLNVNGSPTMNMIKSISKITGKNYIDSRKLLVNGCNNFVTGKGSDIKDVVNILQENRISFIVNPPFPY